ncbi:MAG: hypothetical protein PHY23_07630 [Oscillospiraceae bacterium]|nr:hypothetical protein [Oscillospiraceae bacterium]
MDGARQKPCVLGEQKERTPMHTSEVRSSTKRLTIDVAAIRWLAVNGADGKSIRPV